MREFLAEHSWPVFLVCLGVAGAHVLIVQDRVAERLAAWWVPRASRRGRWAGPWSAGVSTLAAAGFVVMVLVAHLPGDSLPWWWPWLVDTVALAVYLPFGIATAPSLIGGKYSHWRPSLREQGADDQLQKRIAWWAGLPSYAGLWIALAWAALVLSRAGG